MENILLPALVSLIDLLFGMPLLQTSRYLDNVLYVEVSHLPFALQTALESPLDPKQLRLIILRNCLILQCYSQLAIWMHTLLYIQITQHTLS